MFAPTTGMDKWPELGVCSCAFLLRQWSTDPDVFRDLPNIPQQSTLCFHRHFIGSICLGQNDPAKMYLLLE